MPTPRSSRPDDDGHLSARERAVFDDLARRLDDVSGGPPAARPTPTVDGLAWVRWTLQVMIVAVAVSLAPSSRWAAVAVIGTALAVELLLIVRRRRQAASAASDQGP